MAKVTRCAITTSAKGLPQYEVEITASDMEPSAVAEMTAKVYALLECGQKVERVQDEKPVNQN